MLTVKYFWRTLTEDGLLKPFKSDYWDNVEFGRRGYDSEEEAIDDFVHTLGERYLFPHYMLC